MQNKRPPGTLKYKKDNIYIYKVCGSQDKLFCQNLCLFAKLFLDHKSLYYLIQEFNFYVLYISEQEGEADTMVDDKILTNEAQQHEQDDEVAKTFVGYFSKDKNNSSEYNLSCILTLPSFQRKGWGRFLVKFSKPFT